MNTNNNINFLIQEVIKEVALEIEEKYLIVEVSGKAVAYGVGTLGLAGATVFWWDAIPQELKTKAQDLIQKILGPFSGGTYRGVATTAGVFSSLSGLVAAVFPQVRIGANFIQGALMMVSGAAFIAAGLRTGEDDDIVYFIIGSLLLPFGFLLAAASAVNIRATADEYGPKIAALTEIVELLAKNGEVKNLIKVDDILSAFNNGQGQYKAVLTGTNLEFRLKSSDEVLDNAGIITMRNNPDFKAGIKSASSKAIEQIDASKKEIQRLMTQTEDSIRSFETQVKTLQTKAKQALGVDADAVKDLQEIYLTTSEAGDKILKAEGKEQLRLLNAGLASDPMYSGVVLSDAQFIRLITATSDSELLDDVIKILTEVSDSAKDMSDLPRRLQILKEDLRLDPAKAADNAPGGMSGFFRKFFGEPENSTKYSGQTTGLIRTAARNTWRQLLNDFAVIGKALDETITSADDIPISLKFEQNDPLQKLFGETLETNLVLKPYDAEPGGYVAARIATREGAEVSNLTSLKEKVESAYQDVIAVKTGEPVTVGRVTDVDGTVIDQVNIPDELEAVGYYVSDKAVTLPETVPFTPLAAGSLPKAGSQSFTPAQRGYNDLRNLQIGMYNELLKKYKAALLVDTLSNYKYRVLFHESSFTQTRSIFDNLTAQGSRKRINMALYDMQLPTGNGANLGKIRSMYNAFALMTSNNSHVALVGSNTIAGTVGAGFTAESVFGFNFIGYDDQGNFNLFDTDSSEIKQREWGKIPTSGGGFQISSTDLEEASEAASLFSKIYEVTEEELEEEVDNVPESAGETPASGENNKSGDQ